MRFRWHKLLAGAHKINHCLGEALLAKKMGKARVITETSGIHGICLASAAAVVGIQAEVYIGMHLTTQLPYPFYLSEKFPCGMLERMYRANLKLFVKLGTS